MRWIYEVLVSVGLVLLVGRSTAESEAHVEGANMAPACKFSSAELWNINTNMCAGRNKVTLSCSVHQRLKELDLLRPEIVTQRGKRAGKTFPKSRDIISGVNFDNLKKVRTSSFSCNNLTIGVVNTRSLRNKTVDFHDNVLDGGYDLCLVTETWLDLSDTVLQSEATPDGFCFDHHPRSDRNGGGVGFICRREMKPVKREICPAKTFEFCEWKIKFQNTELLVVVVYRPPYSNKNKWTVNEFIEEFGTYLENWITTPHKLLIGGDFNLHMENKNNVDANKFKDLLDNVNLRNHIWLATHELGHALDLIITREADNIIASKPEVMSFISDHAFVKLRTTFQKEEYLTKVIKFRKTKDINMDRFKEDVCASDLMKMGNKSAQEKSELYDKTLSDLFDTHAPLISKTIKIKTSAPWYNQESRSLKRSKRKAERAWLKSKAEVDHVKFKNMRREYIKRCDEIKAEFYSKEIQECHGDQKRLYRLITKLTEGNTNSVYPDCDNDKDLGDRFAEFFIGKIDKIMCDIQETISVEGINASEIYRRDGVQPVAWSTFSRLSSDDVRKLISKSKSKTSILDPLPTKLLKECLEVLIDPITDIINSSLTEGLFPGNWKSAAVVPLLKKTGLENKYCNYRPVSNLAYLSKIVEKAGLEQYVKHLESINMFGSQNSAYKRGHSTETLLVKIHSDIVNNMDHQKVTLLTLLDLTTAFDTVSLEILSDIFVNRFHIGGGVLSWFRSYLTDRSMRVLINDTLSDCYMLRFGVPQGSCAGPVVFLGYLSALYDVIDKHLPNVKCGGYADDHQLYLAFNPSEGLSQEETVEILQKCIADVRAWMLCHMLKINDMKTEFMLVGSWQQLSKVDIDSIRVGNSVIKPAKCLKNLGVIFDQNLDMMEHVTSVCKKGYFQLKRIRQIRKYLDKASAEKLVHSFITSNIDYSNAVLYGVSKQVISKLQKLQNCAARVVCQVGRHEHITPYLKELHWLPVAYRIKYKIALLTYKCVYDKAPKYLSELIEVYKPPRTLRSSEKHQLKVPRCNTKIGSKAFTSAAPEIWNGIPERFKTMNLDKFKSNMKTFLFEQAYKS